MFSFFPSSHPSSPVNLKCYDYSMDLWVFGSILSMFVFRRNPFFGGRNDEEQKRKRRKRRKNKKEGKGRKKKKKKIWM
jgi:hypothetical protein